MHLSAEKQVTGEAIYIDDMPPFAGTNWYNFAQLEELT